MKNKIDLDFYEDEENRVNSTYKVIYSVNGVMESVYVSLYGEVEEIDDEVIDLVKGIITEQRDCEFDEIDIFSIKIVLKENINATFHPKNELERREV